MSTVTIATKNLYDYQGGGSTATLRISLTQNFISSDGVPHLADNQIYKDVACSVSGTTLTIPAFVLDSTTDGLDTSRAKYKTQILDSNGDKVAPYITDFFVRPTPISQEWADIVAYNNVYKPKSTNSYYTVPQIDRIIADLPDGLTQFTGYVNLSDYGNSLATAISEIGGANKIINISIDSSEPNDVIVPTNILINSINGAKIVKSGSGSITFQGIGLTDPTSQKAVFQGYDAGDVVWTGTVYPSEIAANLWDTVSTSLSARISRADTALSGKKATIICHDATNNGASAIDSGGIRITQYHHLYFSEGSYANTLNTYAEADPDDRQPAFLLDSDTRVSGSNLAFINESANDGNVYLFYAYPMRAGGNFTDVVSNIIIEHLNIIGSESQEDISGANSIIQLGNCHDSFIRYCRFYRAHGYVANLGGYGTAGTYALNSGIHDNLFIQMGSQLANLYNCKNCFIRNNHFDQTTSNNTTTYVVIDVEPNTADSVLENIQIEYNTIDLTGETVGAKFVNGIAVQAANILRAKNIVVRGNSIIGRRMEGGVINGALATAIQAYGVQELTVEDNYVRGAVTRGYQIENCRYVNFRNNTGILIGDAGNNNAALYMTGVSGGDVSDNRFNEAYTAIAQATGIYDSELEFLVTSSGATVTNISVAGAARFYSFWADGFTFNLNNSTWTVSSVTDYDTLAATSSIGTLTVKSVASASDVNTGTDTITSTSHGFENGARLRYTAGAGAIGGLTTATTYFVVNKTANTFQLALTAGGAAIDLTSTGTGTQTFTPVLRTIFSSNTYNNNKAADGITKEAGSTVYSTYTDVFAGKQDLDADLTAIAALTSAANKLPYATGAQTWALADFTAAGRALVDDADATAQRATLGLGNVDNTSDANKPVSTAQQTALDLKANLVSPSFTTPNIGVGAGTSLAVTGLLKSSGTAGVGYATGAGGTVTQATSKVTAFTLNKTCGQITFAGDQLDAGEVNSATWTNTTIAATDVVAFNHLSGGTIGAYIVDAQCGAGTATINIKNITAGNLTEAPVFSFVVIKGVTS